MRGKEFFSLCKHPISTLTNLTDGNQFKKKPFCLQVPASAVKFSSSLHPFVVTVGCSHMASELSSLAPRCHRLLA